MSNTFRKAYRELNDDEREHVKQIKDAAERLEMVPTRTLRCGKVINYPRQHKHVWNLVARMLKAMGYA